MSGGGRRRARPRGRGVPARATYRLQVNRAFPLRRVTGLVPYLARLGISHVYTSPLLAARRGSMHGYDIADPDRLNPEIGTERSLRALATGLHRRGMGLLVDIVPNHMAAGPENPAWDDVLAHGRRSRFAHWFDIDWDAPGSRDRVTLPVLGAPLAEVLARGEIRLVRRAGRPRLSYFDHSFPVDPATLAPSSPSAPRARGGTSAATLAALLAAQHYRLVHWTRAGREVNYRRFFDINELVAIRPEDPRVFAARHARVLRWVAAGWIDGLRIDHIDGLRDPAGYLRHLVRSIAAQQGRRRAPLPVYVEKILCGDETLPERWPVAGTTGYEFIASVEPLLLDAGGFDRIASWYATHIARQAPRSFAGVVRAAKRRMLTSKLAADVSRVARLLVAGAGEATRPGRRAHGDLGAAIVEVIVQLDVYRTYVGASGTITRADARLFAAAVERARRTRRARPRALALLRDALLRRRARAGTPAQRRARLEAVWRFQQTSGPAMAKGLEDTAHYAWVPLVSLNEVGTSPEYPARPVKAFHAANRARGSRWPASMLGVSTHDTKRSADVRARLDVLSELADTWIAAVGRWRRLNARHRSGAGRRRAPDGNTEYLFYQSLVGIWPLAGDGAARSRPSPGALEGLRERLSAYMLKAVREAKLRTSWVDPDAGFESALKRFIDAVLGSATFVADVAAFVAGIVEPGLWNSLARTALQLTSPGVPDIYQGDEVWNFALVDPDNRRPVDFRRRSAWLDDLEAREARRGRADLARALADDPRDPRLKLHVVRSILDARRRRAALYATGSYEPLVVRGDRAAHLIGFARRRGRQASITLAPRLVYSLLGDGAGRPVGPRWGTTEVEVPAALGARPLTDVLTGERCVVRMRRGRGVLEVAEVLRTLPVAVLCTR